MRLQEGRNEKTHQAFMVGLDAARGKALRLDCRISVNGSLTDCSSYVNHPTTLNARLIALVGETTRRASLNLHRGSQIVGTQRGVGKREWQRETVKSRRQRMAPSVINSARFTVGEFRLRRADSPSVIRV
jgi:hypothetical protein